MHFIVLFIEYDDHEQHFQPRARMGELDPGGQPTDAPSWLPITCSARHHFTTQGSTYNALKGNSNLFLMLGGHLIRQAPPR